VTTVYVQLIFVELGELEQCGINELVQDLTRQFMVLTRVPLIKSDVHLSLPPVDNDNVNQMSYISSSYLSKIYVLPRYNYLSILHYYGKK